MARGHSRCAAGARASATSRRGSVANGSAPRRDRRPRSVSSMRNWVCEGGHDHAPRVHAAEAGGMKAYERFLDAKQLIVANAGVNVSPTDINPKLFPFQRTLVQWALRKGRSAIFSDCGTGKTF